MTDEQMKKIFDFIRTENQDTREKLNQMEYQMEDIKTSIDKIYTILDSHWGFLETDEVERLAMGKQLTRTNEKVDDHESRILELETIAAV